MKNKKGNCDFLPHNSDFFSLTIANLHLAILTRYSLAKLAIIEKLAIMCYKVRIARYKVAIVRKSEL